MTSCTTATPGSSTSSARRRARCPGPTSGPRPAATRCSRCLSPWLSWHTVPGFGVVYSFSVARQATATVFEDEVPQIITVVELPEGVRLSTTLVDVDADDVRVGLPVEPVFEPGDDGITLLRYRPATPT